MSLDFLDSFTFASGKCECCDEVNFFSTSASASASSNYTNDFIPLQRRQTRTLLQRDDPNMTQLSIWKLQIPLDSEPLLEFGYSHRIVFVKQLPKNAKTFLVRRQNPDSKCHTKEMKWKEQCAYFFPSNIEQKDRTGMGWICQSLSSSATPLSSASEKEKEQQQNENENEKEVEEQQHSANNEDKEEEGVFYILKLSPDKLQSYIKTLQTKNDIPKEENSTTTVLDSNSFWAPKVMKHREPLVQMFQSCVDAFVNANSSDAATTTAATTTATSTSTSTLRKLDAGEVLESKHTTALNAILDSLQVITQK